MKCEGGGEGAAVVAADEGLLYSNLNGAGIVDPGKLLFEIARLGEL